MTKNQFERIVNRASRNNVGWNTLVTRLQVVGFVLIRGNRAGRYVEVYDCEGVYMGKLLDGAHNIYTII
jgi:hypothetical protein